MEDVIRAAETRTDRVCRSSGGRKGGRGGEKTEGGRSKGGRERKTHDNGPAVCRTTKPFLRESFTLQSLRQQNDVIKPLSASSEARLIRWETEPYTRH